MNHIMTCFWMEECGSFVVSMSGQQNFNFQLPLVLLRVGWSIFCWKVVKIFADCEDVSVVQSIKPNHMHWSNNWFYFWGCLATVVACWWLTCSSLAFPGYQTAQWIMELPRKLEVPKGINPFQVGFMWEYHQTE